MRLLPGLKGQSIGAFCYSGAMFLSFLWRIHCYPALVYQYALGFDELAKLATQPYRQTLTSRLKFTCASE